MELMKTARGYEYKGFSITRKNDGAHKFYVRFHNRRLNEMATAYFRTLAGAKSWIDERTV